MHPLSSAPLSPIALTLRARCLLVPGALLAFALGAAACGSPAGGDASPDAAMDAGPSDDAADDAAHDAAPDGPFEVAAHDPYAQIPNAGGPLLAHPQLVTVTFADDTARAQDEAFDRWIVGSSWLTTVGAEYGVGAGTVLQDVELADNAPDTITDDDLQAMLNAQIEAGSIPAPSADGNTLYMVYFPSHTTIRDTASTASCQNFAGYHRSSHAPPSAVPYAYAVIPSCPMYFQGETDLQAREIAASHELIEAATDPLPFDQPAYALVPPTQDLTGASPWIFVGGEIADLCLLSPEFLQQDGHTVQRVWSNSAAAAGVGNPCIPQDPTAPYYGTSASPTEIQTVSAGGTVTFQLTGFSSAPTTAWTLSTIQGGPLHVTARLSATRLNNGGTATLTAAVPATAQSGTYAVILLYSSHSGSDYHVWPLAVSVQ